MNDIAGAAPPAAEPSAAAPADAGNQPATDAGHQEPVIDRSTETARASVDRAFAQLDKQSEQSNAGKVEGEGATDAQPEAETGKDKTVTPEKTAGALDAPSRFSPDAKAAWATVPDSVKGEVNRAFRELEGGLSQYQQFFEPLKPYYKAAQEMGVTVHEALESYVSIDRKLVSKNPQERLGAIEHLLGYAGLSPRDYAAFIMGQKPDQAQSQNDATIRELRQEIAGLKQELGGFSKSFEQRREDDILKQVEAFAENNTRLNEPEFQNLVIRLLKSQMATDLKGAYAMAERLNPAPPAKDVQPAPASTAGKPTPNPAQTRNGNLSVTGAPGSGSNPAKRKTPASARDSIDNAFASLGLNG